MEIENKEFLAKGKRGTVSTGYLDTGNGVLLKVAIKEKRQDSFAMSRMEIESKFLQILNKHNIGPEYITSGKDYLIYKFVEGIPILESFKTANKDEVLKVLKEVFNQCKKLDELGINKEEMHHPIKHVLIGEKIVMIDFERCAYTQKPKNVTQFIQFLTSTNLTKILKEKGINFDKVELRKKAKEYRENKEVIFF